MPKSPEPTKTTKRRKTMQNQLLDAISREGVLASVSIRYWRAAKKLEAEDLGLNDRQIADRLVVLGHKRLLPREALARFALIESRAHAAVERSSFPFLGGIARFVPNRNLARLTETLENLKTEFESEIDSFMDRYEDLRASALGEWRDAARSLDVPVGEFVDRIAATFPSGMRLRQRFQRHVATEAQARTAAGKTFDHAAIDVVGIGGQAVLGKEMRGSVGHREAGDVEDAHVHRRHRRVRVLAGQLRRAQHHLQRAFGLDLLRRLQADRDPPVAHVEVAPADENCVALQVTSGAISDTIISTLDEAPFPPRSVGDVTLRGRLGVVRRVNGAVAGLWLFEGTELTVAGEGIRTERAARIAGGTGPCGRALWMGQARWGCAGYGGARAEAKIM